MATQLKSTSARKVKTVPKGALAFVAKKRLNVEDDTHEADIAKGELFYLQHIVGKGFFVFDLDDAGNEIHKFKVTGKVFKDLKKNNTPRGKLMQLKNSTGGSSDTAPLSKPKLAQEFRRNISDVASSFRLDAPTAITSALNVMGIMAVYENRTLKIYPSTEKVKTFAALMDTPQFRNAILNAGFTFASKKRTSSGPVFQYDEDATDESAGKFTKNLRMSLQGSSKVGSITASYVNIRKLFGKPIAADKAPVHYTFVSDTGYVFSVYSWKQRPSTATPFKFMVGAKSYNEKELQEFAKLVGGKLERDLY